MSSAYTLKSLKTELRKYGGKLSGKKQELIDRLDRLVSCTATYKDFPYGDISEIYIKNLKKNKNKKKEKKNKKVCDVDCCICMESIFVDECKKTECNHMYHEGCLNKWLEESSSCPLCRAQIGEKIVIQSVPEYYLDNNDGTEEELNLMNERIEDCFIILNNLATIEDLTTIENIDRLSYLLQTERLRIQLNDGVTVQQHFNELYDAVTDHYYSVIQFERMCYDDRS